MNLSFVTIKKIDSTDWIIKASLENNKIIVEEKIQELQSPSKASKVARKVAATLNLSYVKPKFVMTENYKNVVKTIKRENKIKATNLNQQNKLKSLWIQWANNFEDNSQVALAEGIFACEKLARNLACEISCQSQYYYINNTIEDKDLSRLAQFNELKKLWIKRNKENIIDIKEINNMQPSLSYQFDFSDFYQETFFSYFESTQLYLYSIKINNKEYNIFSDFQFKKVVENKITTCYSKALYLKEKEEIGYSFGELVPAIEFGGRTFWQKYWSKSKNKLLF